MGTKNVWLLSLMVLALAVLGLFVANTASAVLPAYMIDNIDIEGTDIDGQPSRDEWSIRGVRVWLEGQIDENDDEDLGNLIVRRSNGTEITVKRGVLVGANPGHDLRGTQGTVVDSDSEIRTNSDGEFFLSFILPFNSVGNANDTLYVFFTETADGQYDRVRNAKDQFVKYDVQVPRVVDADVDDRVYRNGDLIDIDLEMETDDTWTGVSAGRGIEVLTILPDLSNVDSRFPGGNSPEIPIGKVPNNPLGRYDLTKWDTTNTNPNALDLYDLVLDVNRAEQEGRLIIIDDGRGDYNIRYTISATNVNDPGMKRVLVHAFDWPSILTASGVQHDILGAKDVFAAAGLAFPGALNRATWYTTQDMDGDTDPDTEDINLDNAAPNFDFAFINPFVNPPCTKWIDIDGDNVADPDEWVYIYKQGDVISVMVSVDPHDLTIDELEEIDDDQFFPDGNEDSTIDNVTVFGDISALLDPSKVDLTTDADGNGIPDRAQVIAYYAGSGGSSISTSDDDFDNTDSNDSEDEEDKTTNGIDERLLFVVNVVVDNTFRGVSGVGSAVTGALPFRFLVKDAAGNVSHYSAWREEFYHPELRRWRQVDIAQWGRDTGLVEPGVREPVYIDEVFYLDGSDTPGFPYPGQSALQYPPTAARARVPQWSNGYGILQNWDQPWRIQIDAAAPSISKFDDLKLEVPPTQTINGPMPAISAGGKSVLATGSFIYEIGGDGLVTVKASFPSDNDVEYVKFMYSDTGNAGSYRAMKGQYTGDISVTGLFDLLGVQRDPGVPGAAEGFWNNSVNGDDDNDRDADFNDRQVYAADRTPQSDGVDNDADGLVDANDTFIDGFDNDGDGLIDEADENVNMDRYTADRDDDEDGIMDEDEFVVKVVNGVATWTFDPVRIARILRLQPDRAYAIKAVPFDCVGNPLNNDDKGGAAIYMVFRVFGKDLQTITGTATAKVYMDGELVTQRLIPENRVYSIEATTTGTVNSVTFQYSNDKEHWVVIPTAGGEPNPDSGTPFKISWRPLLSQLQADFPDPLYMPGDDLYIRAVAGKFGNLGRYQVSSGLALDPSKFAPYPFGISVPVPKDELIPDVTVAVTDSTSPIMYIYQLGLDIDESHDGIDNNGNGQIDEAAENGIADGALVPVATDVLLKAHTTAPDVARAIWQYAKIFPNGTRANWVDIFCTTDLTALPNGGYNIVSKWDTAAWTLNAATPPGRYDVRVLAIDSAGNSDPQLSPIAHVIVGFGKKAAFIVTPIYGAEVSGSNVAVKARIYYDWDTNDDGVISAIEIAAVDAEVIRVMFQYQKSPGGAWILASTDEDVDVVTATYAEFSGTLALFDLLDSYNIRASVQDDKGYVTDGVEIPIKVLGTTELRTKISNFESDATSNPIVSMKIAREGTVPDIWIEVKKDVAVETMRIVLKATKLTGTADPENVRFEYKISGSGVNPKDDNNWKAIGTDADPAWEVNWDIGPGHELHNLLVDTLVYVRARAQATDGTWDSYKDEANYVPFVGMIFTETTEPTATIEVIERDGVTLGDLSVERRVTGGKLNFIPNVYDNHMQGNPQQLSAIAKVDLYYKLCKDESRDGDTLLWNLVGTDSTSPFNIVWDITAIPTGKYDLMMVATDQAGNKSANVWDNISDLRSIPNLVRLLTIDRTGPKAYIENPDGISNSNRLGADRNFLISVSSYEGCIKMIELYYNTGQAGIEYPVESDTAVIRRIYQDLNSNGQWDPGEPYRWELPDQGEGEFLPDVPSTEGGWVKIGEKEFVIPAFSTSVVSSDFNGYYYYDIPLPGSTEGNKMFDAGEIVWQDIAGGNTGKYNYHDRTVKEPIIMGGIRPNDEVAGRRFQDIPADILSRTCTLGVTKWADVNGNGVLDENDFIWIDLDDDNQYDCRDNVGTCGGDGVGEPVVYASNSIVWDKIMDLPPTNNTGTDFRVRVSDKYDSACKPGNWGTESLQTIIIENIVVAVWNVNGRAVENNYDPIKGSGKDYVDQYQRVTGNTVKVRVRVWPEPRVGAEVKLLFRYDDALYPGAPDTDYNGYPDNDSITNSRWDGIDNDWDGTIDEEQKDKDANDKKWGEVNVWRFADVTGGTVIVAEDAGAWDSGPGENWFEVELTWDVSALKGEFQYQFLPVVVDGKGYGPNLNYAGLPFIRSDAKFPQTYDYSSYKSRPNGYRIVIDHKGPYTYTQVVNDTDEYGDTEYALDSWQPLDYCGPDGMMIRANEGWPGDPNSKRNPTGDYWDEAGEDNYRTYDIQGKVVSIYGGLNYTKTFTDQTNGVEFQYRIVGGQWMTLGYDRDPDYMNTYVYDSVTQTMVPLNIERGLPIDSGYVGTMIPYSGQLVKTSDGILVPGVLTTNTQRIVVSTWSMDNVDIMDFVKFPPTNGTEYEFRAIAIDLPDAYGGIGTATGATPDTYFDELVVENRVGDDKAHAANDQNFMRDINWRKGVPFEGMPPGKEDVAMVKNPDGTVKIPRVPEGIFFNPHKDLVNLSYISGPKSPSSDYKDGTYWINNIVPEAQIIRVDETTFNWTPSAGVDPVAVSQKIDAKVLQGEDVLIEAIVNPDPQNKLGGQWSTSGVGTDIAKVDIYARPHPVLSDTNPNYYKGFPTGGAILSNGWMKVGMGYVDTVVDYSGDTGNNRYTIRIDTQKLIDDLVLYSAKGIPLSTRDFELMAMAYDTNCNAEAFMTANGEIIIRVLDMVGPSIKVGGLAHDMEHIRGVINRLDPSTGGVAAGYIEPYLNYNFTDLAGLDLNNFGNALFPSSPNIGDPNPVKPVAKFSGEKMQLYITSGLYDDLDSVTIDVYNGNNAIVAQPSVTYAKDTWNVSTETTPGTHTVNAGLVPHAFDLSEQAALLYLPTWVESGKNVARFENVWLVYKAVDNPVTGGVGSGSSIPAPDQPYGDNKVMTPYYNSKGESIWTVTMNLEIGKTYFYYYIVDTVGDTWVIPDPKNLCVDEGLNASVYPARFDDWFNIGPGAYIAQKNFFINLPVVSKLELPGTPPNNVTGYAKQADDELRVATVDLDKLPDGVYEIRITAKDKVGYSTMVSKTVVVDRTPPPVNPNADIKVDSRVKADSVVPLMAVLPDGPNPGVNAVDTIGVLFEMSRKGNTQEATSTWQYAISPSVAFPPAQVVPVVPSGWIGVITGAIPPWVSKIALDPFPGDGWKVDWATPKTDQNMNVYVRAVPFDDAFNVQVAQGNQVLVTIDGTVPKVKVVRASVVRDGVVIEAGADGFELYPTDKDVTLTAEPVANIDGDLDNDGIIEPPDENINTGLKKVQFQYSLKTLVNPDDDDGAIEWIDIPATQYSSPVVAPNADGKWQVTWQVDFSLLAAQDHDMYIHVRAVAEDQVGNEDSEDTILSIMVLNDTVGPQAYIRYVDCRNVLDPHLAVSKRCCGEGDDGSVDVVIEADNVALVTLEYRKAGTDTWIPVKSTTGPSGPFTVEWPVASLEEGRYELRVAAYDPDGNMVTEPDVVVVIVDHTEPKVVDTKMWYHNNAEDVWYAVVPGEGIYRYADTSGLYYTVKFEAKVDATDPVDKVEAKEVVLQYWDSNTAQWKNVLNRLGQPLKFSYSKSSDLWTLQVSRNTTGNPETNPDYNRNGVAETAAKFDCEGYFRVLATDYACNDNKLDKGFAVKADATKPTILAVYSGGREYEGGEQPTIVAEGGHTVDLWAKIRDDCTGAKRVYFRMPASSATNTTATVALPVPIGTVDFIGEGTLVEEHGGEALFHFLWTTPRNMAYDNFIYDITVEAFDAARNPVTSDPNNAIQVGKVKVEKDVTAPAPPEIRFLVTHAAGATGVQSVDAKGYPGVEARIFDEYCAPWYGGNLDDDGNVLANDNTPYSSTGKIIASPVRKIIDLANPAKFMVFDTYNNWTDENDVDYITVDSLDTSLEIWVRTSELEYGTVQGGEKTARRQYEEYAVDSSVTPNGMTAYGPSRGTNPHTSAIKDPQYLPINYGSMEHDPGIKRVYLQLARDPNQDGLWDDAASASWINFDNTHRKRDEGGNQNYRRLNVVDDGEVLGDAPVRYNRNFEPLLRDEDVVRVPLYDGDKALKGYSYYWVMGDDYLKKSSDYESETIWNTGATASNTGEVLDSALARDGWYIIRTWAEDYNGNGNPIDKPATINYGYAMVYVKNQDDIPPVGNYDEWQLDDRGTGGRVVLEGWHKVRTRTRTAKPAGYDWNFGSNGSIANADQNAVALKKYSNKFCKFFSDVDFVAIQAQDPVSGNWVDLGFATEPYITQGMLDGTADRRSYWFVWIDSTWVEDGKSKLRAVTTDNGGLLTSGTNDVHKQYQDGVHVPEELARRNYQDRGTSTDLDVSIDNPRAKVVLPASGAIVDRDSTITIQALPVSIADEAKNGHDVGRMWFMARRKSVVKPEYNGPWVMIDALDDDLDGLFGEDPIANYDFDKDGKKGEDPISPVDTNEPYLVRWTVPDWLVIDEPRTSAIESTAEYYIVGVAGDSDTGPLQLNKYGTSMPWPSQVDRGTSDKWWLYVAPDGPQFGQPPVADTTTTPTGAEYEFADAVAGNYWYIHFDNMEHIVAHTDRYSLVTVQDTKPPRTRILQVDKYAVPSETKVVVGRTVTVFAGDTEVICIPPSVFPLRGGNLTSSTDYEGTNGLLMPTYTTDLPGTYYTPSWTNELLWGGRYSLWAVPYQSSKHDVNPKNYWPYVWINTGPNNKGNFEAEWRPNDRIKLMYAKAEADGSVPAFPQSGQTWADTSWKVAEADAIDLDDNGNPGLPDWKVTNWVTGDDASGMPDGKYYIIVVATDDVGHQTGIPVGTSPAVMPDIVDIYIDNNGPSVTMTASELKTDGTLVAITNNQMERGQPLVLSIDPKMSVEDLDAVTFQFKPKHDYDWQDIETAQTQPYSALLSPLGAWSGITNEPFNIALGNIYQFRAMAEDSIGNKTASNVIELTVVDLVAEASIARIKRIDGFNADENWLNPEQIDVPRLTGQVKLVGYTDADIVAVTFLYRKSGDTNWIEIEADLNRFGPEGWEAAEWIDDGCDNDGDGLIDEPGECGYEYEGAQMWKVIWDTTTLTDGSYELAVVGNTGENKASVSSILNVIVDHNAYDILVDITDSSPKSGDAVGGWTRRPVVSQNPILDPDDKLACRVRGEVDLFVAFGKGIPADLDMGTPFDTWRGTEELCEGCSPDDYKNNSTSLVPSLTFEFKESAYPNIGDETIHDKTVVEPGYYWKPIKCVLSYENGSGPSSESECHPVYGSSGQCVIYDAATKRFSAVWHTEADGILNGYYDIRVRVVDEAGNVAYKVIAERVIVDNTPPDAMITNINGDTSLTYTDQNGTPNGAMATDTELAQNGNVIIRATAIDSLTSVHSVLFQVKQATIQQGRPLAGNADEVNLLALDLTQWTDIGLLVKDANPENSYSITWDTTGLLEGDYLLRIVTTDVLGNKMFSGAVKVTVIDTVPPVATIVGYYPDQLQYLRFVWPKKPRFDTIYAATICQADVQEVQIQYRSATNENWITIGVPTLIPFEQLDTPEDKVDEIRDIYGKQILPDSVIQDEAIVEAYKFEGLWGTTWNPTLPDGTYYLRAVAKDWSGNIDPDLAPVLPIKVVNGVVDPLTPASGISIDFTTNLGGNGVGDVLVVDDRGRPVPTYNNMPSVVITVEADEKPTVLAVVEVDSLQGLVFGGELVDVLPENGVSGRYNGTLKGDELMIIVANHYEELGNYLDLIRLGGKITIFASTSAGIATTTLTMDDLNVFPVTAELGTNGTVASKDGAVNLTIPRAALLEPTSEMYGFKEQAGVMITKTITPTTPKDQRLKIEPVGQAYGIELFDYANSLYAGFRAGFEPLITIDYSQAGIPADVESMGLISVRYWEPQILADGRWSNDDIINLKVDQRNKKISFNLKTFGNIVTYDCHRSDATEDQIVESYCGRTFLIPHHIFSIVLEKEQGRVDNVVFKRGFQYHDEPDMTYIYDLDKVQFRIVDPSDIDEDNIRVYVDDALHSVGVVGHGNRSHESEAQYHDYDGGYVVLDRVEEQGNRIYYFYAPDHLNLTEGVHTLRIEAWDKSDAVDESDWKALEKTAKFYLDCTPPVVVTHGAQADGVRWFSSVKGTAASITMFDEGVGLNGADLQRLINVDVFKYLTEDSTPLRASDQGNIINYQRKVLLVTSKPILEYCDDYTNDGIDNEKWVGFHEGVSATNHRAWRASYTVEMGQVADGDTIEVVFYNDKPYPTLGTLDLHNENAVYLYEDLTNAYFAVWDGANASDLSVDASVTATGIVSVPATQVPDFLKLGLLNLSFARDPFTYYYQGFFLVDQLWNTAYPIGLFTTASADAESQESNLAEMAISSRGDHDDDDDDLPSLNEILNLLGNLLDDLLCPGQYFVRNMVADNGGPVVTLDVPSGVRADQDAATVSGSATDNASGIAKVSLIINGKTVVEKFGPATSLTVEYTFGAGEAKSHNEVKIVAVDVAGNEVVKRADFGVQEVDAPVIADMTPKGDGVADATPAISASYSDPSGIDLSSVTLSLNGAVITDITVGAASVSYTPTEPLKAGVTYTVKVAVKDNAGTPAEAVWTFALETTKPAITDTTPTGVDQTGMPVISAKFSDAGTGINKDTAKLVVDGKVVDAEIGDSKVTYKPTSVMAKGKHTAELSVADVAGNVATLSWDFSIEEVLPVISGIEPSGAINNDMPILSANFTDAGTGIDTTSVVLTLNGEVVNAAVTATNVSYGVQEPLKPGVTYTVTVKVADKAGNVATGTSKFNLEGTLPVISNMKPTGTVQTVDVAISANYSDAGAGIDISSAMMKVDGVVVPATPSASGISYEAVGLLAGDHTVYVEVADKFGNPASSTWSFKVEQTPPTITSVEPKNGSEIGTATPVLAASYNDAGGTGIDVKSVVLTLNGEVKPATVTESQVSYAVLTPLERGVSYLVSVQVADKAGNIASASSTFSLETTPPKISATKPVGTVSEAEAAAGIMITATLADEGSGVDPGSAVMWVDGNKVGAEATDKAVSYKAVGLVYGEHTVRLVVADMLGNIADTSWKFSVDDSTPPTVTVLSPKQDAVVGVKPVIKISYADEGSGVDLTTISVKVDDKPVTAATMAPTGAKVVAAGEASYEVSLDYGAHTLTVSVKDVAGNEANVEVSFIVEGDILKLVKPHNYPNPSKDGKTKIAFGLSQASDVTVAIYDFTGTLVCSVADTEPKAAGAVEFIWDGTRDGDILANGVYFCKVLAETDSETKYEIIKIAIAR